MNKVKRPYKRRTYIINKKFQYSFILRNMMFLLITFILIFLLMFFWNIAKFRQGFLIQPPNNEYVEEWAGEHNVAPDSAEYAYQFIIQARTYTFFDLTWKPLLIVFILSAVVLFISNIYYSHKIAGPMYRLKIFLQQKINNEELEPIRFRKTDNEEFHELAAKINEALKLR